MTVTILQGDCRNVLPTLVAESVQCVVTSPPYFGLRDYGVNGQIGLETTLSEFIAEIVAVFREVRRVMKSNGTLWLNLGDSYAGSWGAQSHRETESDNPSWHSSQIKNHPKRASGTGTIRDAGLKAKDLMMVPARVALALQADGWWLRKDIIWAKPNPMPESATDRPTSSHEHVFLLTKAERYFYDADAVREGRTSDDDAKTYRGGCYVGGLTDNGSVGKRKAIGNKRVKVPGGWDQGDGSHGTIHRDGRTEATYQAAEIKAGRNLRDVWTIASSPFPQAHFATFPPRLVEPCIKAGSRPGDMVLDPFGGAGTTGLVADRLGRDAMLIELNADYAAMARRRITEDCPMFAQAAE